MKRWAFRITVFLLLGAIVNVAVAWGRAATVPDAKMYEGLNAGTTSNWPIGIAIAYCTRWDCIGFTIIRVEHIRAPVGLEHAIEGFRMDLVPAWGGALEAPDLAILENDEWARIRREAIGVGWPTRALWCDHQHDLTQNSVTRSLPCEWGIWIYAIRAGETRRLLPLRPIWPGFAINTVFYAAILWVLFTTSFALRRRMRIKRDLCPKCAYDLRGGPGSASATCPECGAVGTPR